MLNVLIVDDEPIMRNVYKTLIDWKEHGFNLVHIARDGVDALEVVKTMPVDIVLTDLKMPIMDGLTFINLSIKEQPKLKFIVISGYDEFGLLREAYRLGVSDFLTKLELNSKDFLKVLTKVATDIENDKLKKQDELARNTEFDNMERTISNNKYVLREKTLKELFFGIHGDNIKNKLLSQNIMILEKNIVVMVLQLGEYYEIEKNLYDGDRELFKFAILNVLEELICQFDNTCLFSNTNQEYVLVFSDVPHESLYEHQKNMSNIFNVLSKELENCFTLKISGGVSTIADGYESCKKLYKQATDACEYSFIKGKRRLVNYSEMVLNSHEERFNSIEREQFLKEALQTMDSNSIKAVIPQLIISQAEVDISLIDDIKDLFYKYYCAINYFSTQFDFHSQVEDLLNEYKNKLKTSGDLRELNMWIERIVSIISELVQSDGIISKAKRYINNHYYENISLTDMSKYLNISNRHLSRIFAKTTGMSFTEYLLKVRMEYALSLMKDKSLKVYEVAEKVGYTSVEQFSRMFKKTIGKSPKEFLK